MDQQVEDNSPQATDNSASDYWSLVQAAYKAIVVTNNAAGYVGLLPYADILAATQPEVTKPADRQVAYWSRTWQD